MKMTRFENGLVMGYADYKHLAGLVETSKVVSILSLALCQTHCRQVPDFSGLSKSDLITWARFGQPHSSRSYLRVNMRCALAIFFFKSGPSTFPQRTGHLLGAISGSL